MTKKQELYLAVMEHELSVKAFAAAMHSADTKYIDTRAAYAALPMTMSMSMAAARFVMACKRMNNLNEKKA